MMFLLGSVGEVTDLARLRYETNPVTYGETVQSPHGDQPGDVVLTA